MRRRAAELDVRALISQVGIEERGIGDLLKEARDDAPLNAPAERYRLPELEREG